MSIGLKVIPVTIAAGASLSGGALLGDDVLVGIKMPAAWTAASLSFRISYDAGASWNDLYDDSGSEVVLSPATPTGKYLGITPDPFGGITLIAVRSGTTGTPVNQTVAAPLVLVARKTFPIR
jgi:hypothetical protein